MVQVIRNLYWSLLRKQPQRYKPVILITGCGSGIGLALAELLATQIQYRVVITARKGSVVFLKRRFAESHRLWVRELDVNNSWNRTQLIAEITSEWQGVDILINNAGIAYRAVVEHMNEADELLQINTNYLGPASLIRLVLPSMREKGRGKIINVSSVSGMLAMPTMASYSASKHALDGMSEALWYETKPLGINVSLIQPGFIRSDSFQHVRFTGQSNPLLLDSDQPYADYYSDMVPFIERLMNRSFATTESIAKKILKVIQTENPPLWIPVTLDATWFYYLRRILPRRLLLPVLFHFLPGAKKWARSYSKSRTLAAKKSA